MINMVGEGSRDSSKRALRKNEPSIIDEPNCCFISRREDSRLFCCRCAHKRRASPLTCLAICFLVLTYNLLGGFLFLAIEGNSIPEETSVAASKPNLSQSQSGDLRSRTVERLWSITEDLNILYKENWTKLAAKELMDFQRVLMKSMQTGDTPSISTHYDAVDYRWTFAGSFLYALTLITTIGHGSVTPKSSVGKVAAILYACVGIPLIMLYLSTIGEALARSFRSLYSKLCPARLKSGDFHSKADCLSRYSLPGVECKQFVDCDRKEKLYDRQRRTPFQAALNLDSLNGGYHWTCRDHTRVPILISLLLIILYIALGTFLFHTTERWNLIDGCYFSFSSLATIGFGNLRPGLYASTVSAKAEDIAIGVCCIYILVGIVVVAMCFNLIQEDMSSALRGFTALCTGNSKTRAVHSVEKCDENISMAVVS
ncbi:TWiK family of potassium channels protein 7-like [Vanessa tameamea]|uniref:TWiK family of potassium channels protein 7-like n=1 Tax=Vanessa tameamea TaxID=334116 RepID=A0A8B8HSV2_VANTA